jgi:hypothetical protein
MNFAVLWRAPADAEMFAQLVRAKDKDPVFAAAEDLEARLSQDPFKVGESRGNPLHRIAFVRLLCFLFSIDEENRTVHVERVRWVG